MSDGGSEVADIDAKSAGEKYSTMKCFHQVGWALPVRSTFRYSLKQKKVLCEYFIKGEANGKKMTGSQVAKLTRSSFTTSEYLTENQIKSLFSRWSKLKREGKLKPPTDDTASQNKLIQTEEQAEDNDDHNAEFQEESVRITNLLSWSKDDWVAVEYEGKWYPGMVKEVGDLITVKSMEVPTLGKNCFKWPKSVDVLPY